MRVSTGNTDGWSVHSSSAWGVAETGTQTDVDEGSDMVEDSVFMEVGGPFPVLVPRRLLALAEMNSGVTIEPRVLLWSRIAISVALPAAETEATAIKTAALWTIEMIKCFDPAGGGATGVSLPR